MDPLGTWDGGEVIVDLWAHDFPPGWSSPCSDLQKAGNSLKLDFPSVSRFMAANSPANLRLSNRGFTGRSGAALVETKFDPHLANRRRGVEHSAKLDRPEVEETVSSSFRSSGDPNRKRKVEDVEFLRRENHKLRCVISDLIMESGLNSAKLRVEAARRERAETKVAEMEKTSAQIISLLETMLTSLPVDMGDDDVLVASTP